MPFIPRQVKPPARIALTCKVPEATATLLKHYAEFLDSTQEYVVVETLRLAFRRDKEFHAWLAASHPETRAADREPPTRPADPPRPTPASGGRPDSRGEQARS
jgi:hypothetical protein